ncbi:MAG: N-acetylmuramoyl-L-alanine amidase [Bacteroidetes bacterium]|nr:MAG: N-acetylmuramoyl-L-alanine amidase [Bacteroidota bacterium]
MGLIYFCFWQRSLLCKYKFYIDTINLKRQHYIVIILILVFFHLNLFGQTAGNKGKKISTVVIDAGHGGKDPGASGSHSREKDITLAVALKVGRYIKANLPDVKVIYTRTRDRFVPLIKRGEIANKNKADLFISIHCNANNSHKPYGAETYVLGSDDSRSNRNMKVAMLENAAILLEDNAKSNYDGFDPNSPESYIIFSLKQNDYKQEESLVLAQKIQSQFKNRAGRKDRGVHQAGFLVLAGTYMPSVLVELGYLSNYTEEKYLLSEKGQSYLASAIYRAVKSYKQNYELENKTANNISSKTKQPKLNTTVKENTKVSGGVEYRVQFTTSTKKIPVTDKRFRAIPDVSVYYHNGLYKYTSGHFNTISEAAERQHKLKNRGYRSAWVVKMKGDKRYTGSVKNSVPKVTGQKATALEYRVQFYTSPQKRPLTSTRFKGVEAIAVYYQNGLYKYTAGHFSTISKATAYQKELRQKGFSDAFVIKWKEGKRVE